MNPTPATASHATSSASTPGRVNSETSASLDRSVQAIFGTGRSGSTWLGAIVDSHPEVAYRFEPFNRLAGQPSMQRVLQRIKARELDESFRVELQELLLKADPKTSKPPFFPKRWSSLPGRTMLWGLGNVTRQGWLYRSFYTPPKDRAKVVFKEVDRESAMVRLVRDLSMPVVYLMRHPAAYVSSMLRGQESQLMSTGRLSVLPSLLEKCSAQNLSEEFLPKLDQMSLEAKFALFWRMSVDVAWQEMHEDARVCFVVYEQLCQETQTQTERVLGHLGLELTDQTRKFLDASTRHEGDRDLDQAKAKKQDYFTVFRNPLVSMNKWKDRLTDQQKREIAQTVDSSKAYQTCRNQGIWE